MDDEERKTTDRPFDPDKLRPPSLVCVPDPRSSAYVRIDDPAIGAVRDIELSDYYEEVAELTLHAGVPGDIVAQFETARNLYLYAWFVYRFYIVAEHQGLACLELALRDRLKAEISAGKIRYKGKKVKKPMLRLLLGYAVQQELIKNEGFEVWRNRGIIRSRARVEMEKLREMTEKKLDEITWDKSDIEVTAEDQDWDYVSALVDFLPELRNRHAHGSTDLHNWTLNSIRIASEIINQLYQKPK